MPETRPDWVGRVSLAGGAVATLRRDGRWECDDEDLRLHLQSAFDPKDATGVDVLFPFGRMAVANAAAALGGEAEFSEGLPPLEPGEIS